MNGGKYDGGRLSEKQKELREFYKSLLNFSLENEAVGSGKFYDLMYANPYDTLPNRDKVYAWLRHSENQKLLFVTKFDPECSGSVRIRVPEHAFGEMGLGDKATFRIQGVFRNSDIIQFSKTEFTKEGLLVHLEGWDGKVFEIR